MTQTERTAVRHSKRDGIIPCRRILMSRVYIARSCKGFCCAAVTPVDSHAAGNCLGKIQRHVASGLVPDANMQPGLTVIGDVHCTHIHGACHGFDVFQRPVPPPEHQTVVRGAIWKHVQRLGFLQSVRRHQRAVVIIEIDVFMAHRCRRSTPARLYRPDSCRHVGDSNRVSPTRLSSDCIGNASQGFALN